MNNKTSYVECLKLNSQNGFIPPVAKAKQTFLKSFVKFGHIALVCFHAFEHSSDILSIRFKHTRILRFFGLLKK